jgi:hypothetical protein
VQHTLKHCYSSGYGNSNLYLPLLPAQKQKKFFLEKQGYLVIFTLMTRKKKKERGGKKKKQPNFAFKAGRGHFLFILAKAGYVIFNTEAGGPHN